MNTGEKTTYETRFLNTIFNLRVSIWKRLKLNYEFKGFHMETLS